MVCEIGIDGSLLVRPDAVPKEWSWEDRDDPRLGRIDPTFFLIDADPDNPEHEKILEEAGYCFDPTGFGPGILGRICGITQNLRNKSVKAGAWATDQIQKLGLPIDGGFKSFSLREVDGETAYFTVATQLYGRNGRFYQMGPDGTLTEIYQAPGRILSAVFHPLDRNRLLLSSEGYDEGDPRWQSLFEIDLATGDWKALEFPKPSGNDLYGSPRKLFRDEGIMLLNRYGFVPEGGGLWLANLEDPDYDPKRRLLGWDHSQIWMFFPTPNPRVLDVVFTAKEVDNHMTMTVNRAKLRLDGLNTQLTEPERITKLKGWNPQPIHTEEISEYRHLIYIASNDYEACMESRPAAVYVIEIQSAPPEGRRD
ncbi:MAG: hypothetical protein BMS9Abin34_198 [Patescibacteria group bacterium]|nr:MAG: hypothetical protein BMS9Abin34_198 [Patescibacteria group bacterium]